MPAADRPGIPIDRAVPALEMRRVSKAFGGIDVLRNVDFTLRAGEIHALMGENGAGKSTLMKIAGGIYDDYRGEIAVFGEPVRFASPRDASRAGVAVIHQELNLVPADDASPRTSISATRRCGACPLSWTAGAQARPAARILDTPQLPGLPARSAWARLRIGEQQLVEIAKALAQNARILIMDEPTSALPVAEAERLHAIIRRLAAEGVGIVYISHRMEEVFDLADRPSRVLRDGARRRHASRPRSVTRRDLIRAHGRPRRPGIPDARGAGTGPRRDQPARPPVLSVRDLWLAHPKPTAGRPRLIDGVSFDVAAGRGPRASPD